MSVEFPYRPDHPDFWDLAAVLQDFDMVMDDAKTEAEKERRHRALTVARIDPDSLAYIALQRAMRVLGLRTVGEVTAQRELVTKITAAYYEAVIVGIEIERRRRKPKD